MLDRLGDALDPMVKRASRSKSEPSLGEGSDDEGGDEDGGHEGDDDDEMPEFTPMTARVGAASSVADMWEIQVVRRCRDIVEEWVVSGPQ